MSTEQSGLLVDAARTVGATLGKVAAKTGLGGAKRKSSKKSSGRRRSSRKRRKTPSMRVRGKRLRAVAKKRSLKRRAL